MKDEVLRLKITLQGRQGDPEQQLTKLATRTNCRASEADPQRRHLPGYINAFAPVTHPHTQYLSPDNAEKLRHQHEASRWKASAVLQSDNDYVKVVRLVPAGPAAKSKQIATSDKIIGVAQGKAKWSTWSAGAWMKWSS